VAVWQQKPEQKERLKKQETYWLEQLAGELPVLEITTDYPRPSVRQFDGATVDFVVDRKWLEKVKSLSIREGATLYMTLLAIYNVLLYKYTGQEDLIVGTPIAGRSHADVESIVGVFLNTLVFRNTVNKEKGFRDFLAQVKEQVLLAYENSDYPFDELVEKLNLQRDLSRHPVFDTTFTLQNLDWAEMKMLGLEMTPYHLERKNAKFDLSWTAVEGDQLYFSVEYNTSLFKRETIERMTTHFCHLLQQIVENPDLPIKEAELATEEEKQQIIEDFNDTRSNESVDQTIHTLFEEKVKRTPDQIAVTFETTSLTYQQLNARANQLARVLRDAGVERETIVGIMANRSLDTIVAILAVLKAGGAYLPIDPEYPDARIQYMLEDSGTSVLLVHKREEVPAYYVGTWLEIHQADYEYKDKSNLPCINEVSDLAYVIYTSGSTGKPKGVMIEHRGVSQFLVMAKTYGIDQSSRVLQFASLSFDASVQEIFHTLLSGATLVLCRKETLLSESGLKRVLREQAITTVTLPPSLLRTIEYTDLPALTTLVTAGEPCTAEIIRTWGKDRTFINAYGPTEATVCTTLALYQDAHFTNVTIGTPILNKHVYIVNEEHQLQPVGVPGELCIGGKGLARGYLHRPELTAERFVENPFIPGERMYKTGDLARWLPDGTIEYLGRIDNQVKIRGYRIELGEIEAKLLELPCVQEVVVLAQTDETNETHLCAYVVADENWNVSEVRLHLSKNVPDYMIPTHFVKLSAMPLTPNGKVDKKALAQIKYKQETGTEYIAPANVIEASLVRIWQEVLGVESISMNDHFFHLGGHSIKGMMLCSRIQQEWEVELTLPDVFRLPTVKEMATYIQQLLREKENQLQDAAMIIEVEGDMMLDSLQIALDSLLRTSKPRTWMKQGYNMPLSSRVHEIEAKKEEIKQVVEVLVKQSASAETQSIQVSLIRLSEKKNVILLQASQKVADGILLHKLAQDLITAYQQKERELSSIQYKEYQQWMHEQLDQQLAWLSQLYQMPTYVKENNLIEQEIWIEKEGIGVPGTLTIPAGDGPFPVVILIQGDGEVDRDFSLYALKPFKDLALGLASQGIAVLRHEKRTNKHYGYYEDYTAYNEFVEDTLASIDFLRSRKEIDTGRIFLLGHCRGGWMIPDILEKVQGPSVAGGILLSAPDPQITAIEMVYQRDFPGASKEEMEKYRKKLRQIESSAFDPDQPHPDLEMVPSAKWWHSIKDYVPAQLAAKQQVPLLILQGGRDLNVPANDLEKWKIALGDREDIDYQYYPKLNHGYVEGEGAPSFEEYLNPGNVPFYVIQDIVAWINKQIREKEEKKHTTMV
ncbi:non-ribosomal peptide synthetase, partial [Thermoflavimicrobium dichotomicum]